MFTIRRKTSHGLSQTSKRLVLHPVESHRLVGRQAESKLLRSKMGIKDLAITTLVGKMAPDQTSTKARNNRKTNVMVKVSHGGMVDMIKTIDVAEVKARVNDKIVTRASAAVVVNPRLLSSPPLIYHDKEGVCQFVYILISFSHLCDRRDGAIVMGFLCHADQTRLQYYYESVLILLWIRRVSWRPSRLYHISFLLLLFYFRSPFLEHLSIQMADNKSSATLT